MERSNRRTPPQPSSRHAKESRKPQQQVLIAVMGVTGAGKSSFINTACGREVVKTSNRSQPCTQYPRCVELHMVINDEKRPIVLIDTPGFDDDKRSDVRILEDIATWMARKGYLKENMLDGLIFLHPITYTRAGGSEISRTQLLEKILGPNSYNRVIIATTMWDFIVEDEAVQERLDTRFGPGGVWHELKSKGAVHVKHENNKNSAHDIIRRIIEITDTHGKPQTMLETDLKETQGQVIETSAGRTLERQIQKRIATLQGQLSQHLDERPPGIYKNSKVAAQRSAFKRWNARQRELQAQIAHEQQQLKKLQNIVVRIFNGFASLFGGSRTF